MIDRTTVSAIAAELGVSWHTVNTIAMQANRAVGYRSRSGLSTRQHDRLTSVLDADEHIAVKVAYVI